ncbi:MAG TPA: hypothetical protein VIJ14_08835, partial [Rhabdochlamydiaceae bacterium]
MSVDAVDSGAVYDPLPWESPSIFLGETPDPLQMETDLKKTLSERVVVDLTIGKTARYNVDRCLNVDGPTELYRTKMAKAWEKREKANLIVRNIFVLAGVVSFFLSSVPGFLICMGLAWWLSSDGADAQQRQLYSIPPYQKSADQRAYAYQKSFPAIYALGLQWTPLHNSGVLHPNEVEYHYQKYFDAFSQKLLTETPSTNEEKKAWFDQFFSFNPLSPAMLEYGLKTVPPSLEQLGKEYERLFPTTVSYPMLRSKLMAFTGPIGPVGPVGRTGMYPSPSYLYKLEGLCVEHEKKLEDIMYGYLRRKENLRFHYGKLLSKIAPEALPIRLEFFNDKYEYDLKNLKDPY